MVAKVLVEIKAKSVDHTFDYNIPLGLMDKASSGKRVLVPFGRTTLEGFIMSLEEKSSLDNIKDIIDVIDEEVVLTDDLIDIGNYISKKTLCTKISAYQSMLPRALKANKGFNVNKKYVSYIRLIDKDYIPKNDKQKKLLELLSTDKLKSELKEYSSSINTLIKQNVIEEYKSEIYRLSNDSKQINEDIVLNDEQLNAYKKVMLSKDKFSPFLLYGVTGSGKTEVYMHIIKDMISLGKSAIVLVPEISLTAQLVNNFKKRFGSGIAVLHSRLSDGEKYDEWRKIVRGEVSIVIGARSAIFAPLKNIGVIIIDEEHTPTYKQESNPKYYAIDIALYRAKKYGIPLVLGSATPSLESYTRAKAGIYNLLKLSKRINNNLPVVKLINMADEIKKGNKIFSSELIDSINRCLEKKEQCIILLNRRGYSTTVSCHGCGYKIVCPNCDIPLTYHKKTNTMKCHYCDYTTFKPIKCPECKSDDINQFGIGTERLEEEINKIFDARVIRMDIDTTSLKGSHEKILNSFQNHEYDILIGTQMISKGLDFSNVTLVGVINGDASLNIPDFRSSERTYSLLNQVAGRAGRGVLPGSVIIQGFNLEHYSILKAKIHDYDGFYDEEMKVRKALKYPPYYNLSVIKVISQDYDLASNYATKICSYLKSTVKDIIVLGPSSDVMPKINNKYYIQITIKYKKSNNLYDALKYINSRDINKKIKVDIDINPIK